MRELERLATIAGRVLADVATGQPVRDPRTEGAPMPEPHAPADDGTQLALDLANASQTLDALAATLDAASFQVDGIPSADIRVIATTLFGAAYRAAMGIPGEGATAMLNHLDRIRGAKEATR